MHLRKGTKMQYKNNEYTLSTGKKFYANNGILGLNPDGTEFYEGYDGDVETPWTEPLDCDDDDDPRIGNIFTPEERKEIADEMIKRWEQWAKLTKEDLNV